MDSFICQQIVEILITAQKYRLELVLRKCFVNLIIISAGDTLLKLCIANCADTEGLILVYK